MKKIILLISICSCLILSGCSSLDTLLNSFVNSNDNYMTTAEFQEILNDMTYDTYESKVEFSMKSTGGNDLTFTYIISEANDYIKTIKEINGVTETNILYKENNTYYLYNNIDSDETLVEITFEQKEELFDKVITEQSSYYENMKADDANDIIKTNDVITYNETINDIYYENTLILNDNKLVEFKKVFTKDNSINTVSFKVFDSFEIEIPGGNL